MIPNISHVFPDFPKFSLGFLESTDLLYTLYFYLKKYEKHRKSKEDLDIKVLLLMLKATNVDQLAVSSMHIYRGNNLDRLIKL